jgi:ABC-type sugar transport system ATPase subunit
MLIEIQDLTVRFGSTVAVDAMELRIENGEFLALVGPSGCGKTTTLHFVAGLIRDANGRLLFDGDDVTRLGPQDRNLGLVFQDYAIYPHLSVEENIRFPLDVARVPRAQARLAVRTAAELVGVEELLNRRPHQLSGGQRQRIALARALVKRPNALLLDEPLSNLDAHLRVQTRAEIRRLQTELGITTILVTHDQSEALAVADRVAVMSRGGIVGLAPPDEMYARPPSLDAARFIGSPQMNLWSLANAEGAFARAALGDGIAALGGGVVVGVRPEDVKVGPGGVAGRILLRETLGRDLLLHVQTEGDTVRVLVDPAELPGLAPGQSVSLSVAPADWHVFAASDGRRQDLTGPRTDQGTTTMLG